MKITIASPKRPSSRSGNDVTSARWARRLTELGHEVDVAGVNESEVGGDDPAAGADLLVALHARRCGGAVSASRRHAPGRPIVVGLAGTDLYSDLPHDPVARSSIETADRLVVLQDAAIDRLRSIDLRLGLKAHVVYQSVEPPLPSRADSNGDFVVLVLAHLRAVKDPLLAAAAARQVPATSRIRVVHAGHASDTDWHDSAVAEQAANPRYEWLGELERREALDLLASATALACTSRLEGGANVVSEAIAIGVPVVGTDIEGNRGLLGPAYPGLVRVGDAVGLGNWLHRLETESGLLDDLTMRVGQRKHLTEVSTERDGWQAVLAAI